MEIIKQSNGVNTSEKVKHLNVIRNHESHYINFINHNIVDESFDYSGLKLSIMYFGKNKQTSLMKSLKEENTDNDLSMYHTMKKVIGFLDMLLVNSIKTIDDFKHMSLKNIYIYSVKRLLFNRKYIVKCDTYFIFEELLSLIESNNIDLINLEDYVEGLQ